jgi:hypothetical protein
MQLRAHFFWAITLLIVLVKLVIVADLPLAITYGPHDDSIYVQRALSLISGDGFGTYDSRVLVKYPGISLWLAGARLLGLPFLLSVNLVYLAAGVYMLAAFIRCNTSRDVALVSFGLYVLNPITLCVEWTRVIREPLSTGIFIALAASMLHIAVSIELSKKIWAHLLAFSIAFSFSLYLREDDQLLWGLLFLFVTVLAWQDWVRKGLWTNQRKLTLLAIFMIPVVTALGYQMLLRGFVNHHYGLPILHELSEGEYPRFMAALRSIDSAKDNRMVMVPQETLNQLRIKVPSFAPVIDLLPPPGTSTNSCKLHGVCSEWSNGWMPFWIRDAAFRSGLTPSLPAAQAYFRNVRLDIEGACESGQLKCTSRGSSLVPPMELRWVRAYIAEAWRLAGMAVRPTLNVIDVPQVIFDVPLEVGRQFQAVTMTDKFDTEYQSNFSKRPENPYVSPLAYLRPQIEKSYQFCAAILLLVSFIVFSVRFIRLTSNINYLLSPLSMIAIVTCLYLVMRFLILSYVAVFMGAFDPRMMFSTHTFCVFFALPFLFDYFFKEQTRISK